MSDTFDPYREWLDIADTQRPLNHYALLGVEMFEEDQEKIFNGAMKNMAHVLEFDPGPHGQEARRIFDELDAARNCLSDPAQKRAYDQQLRQQMATSFLRAKKSIGDGSQSSVITSTGGSSVARRQQQQKPASAPTTHVELSNLPPLARAGAVVVGLALIATVVYFVVRDPPEPNPVPSLVKQLQNKDAAQRLAAARSLKKLGTRASDAIPQIVQLLGKEPDDDVRVAMAEALLNAGPGTSSFARDLEIVKTREMHPGVRQMIDQLTGK